MDSVTEIAWFNKFTVMKIYHSVHFVFAGDVCVNITTL